MPGSAIQCYICNSGDNFDGKKCDPPNDDFLLDCAEWGKENNYPDVMNATLCRKQIQTGRLLQPVYFIIEAAVNYVFF